MDKTWVFETDNERECYRILTKEPIIEHDGTKERQWIADVFEESHARYICSLHKEYCNKVKKS